MTNHISGMKYEAFLCVNLPSLVCRYQKHWRRGCHEEKSSLRKHLHYVRTSTSHVVHAGVSGSICEFFSDAHLRLVSQLHTKREKGLSMRICTTHVSSPINPNPNPSLCFCCFASQITSQPLIDEAKIFKKAPHTLYIEETVWKQWCELTWNPVMNRWRYNIQCAKCVFFLFWLIEICVLRSVVELHTCFPLTQAALLTLCTNSVYISCSFLSCQ